MPALSFSIVVCTHNPDWNIFIRLLDAIKQLQIPIGDQLEVVVVDNNSKIPLAADERLKLFMSIMVKTRVVVEEKPGLTNARIAGINAAKGNWIIFFDDDNEPAADYLTKSAALIEAHPKVACLGPGIINVEFTGNISEFAVRHKSLFQYRKMTDAVFDNVRWEQEAYPFGTGMIIRKDVLNEYKSEIAKGNYTLTDRIGNSMISGGDIQILLTAIKMGYYAGSSPQLRLNHLISPKKTRFRQMLKLVLFLSASAIKCYNEVFTDKPFEIKQVSNKDVVLLLKVELRKCMKKAALKEALLSFYTKLGELYAHVVASPTPVATPSLLSFFIKQVS